MKNQLHCLCVALLCFLSFSAFSQNCTVNAGIPQTVCANATMTLTGQANGSFPGGTPSITWTQVSGPLSTITSPGNTTTTVTGFSAGTYVFRISTSCLDGSNISDNVTVTVKPVVIANAGPDVAYCPGTFPMAANSASPGTGSWSIVGTNNGVSVSTNNSPTSNVVVSPTNSGNTTLRWTTSQTTTGTTCTSFDDVVITNRGGVAAVNAGADITLNNCYTTTHSTQLGGSFAGTGIDGQQGAWTQVSGSSTATFSNAAVVNPTVSNLVQGTYIFRWTVSGPCVNGFDDVQVTVPPPTSGLTNIITMSNQNFCDGRTSTVLSATQPSFSGETASWSVVAGAGTFASPTSYNTQVTAMSSGANTYRYTITNAAGCSAFKDVIVTSTTPPTVNITTASPVALNCGTSQATVNYTSTGGTGTTQYRVIAGPAGYTLPSNWSNANTATSFTATGLTVPGTYMVRLIRYGTINCDAATQDIMINVSQTPTLSNAGTDQLLACNVTTTALAGNVPNLGSGSWSQVSGPSTAIIANPSLYNSTISGLVPGAYDFKWIINAGNGCAPSEDVVRVRVASTTPTGANAGADRSNVCHSSPVKLDGNAVALNEIGTWTVSPSTGISFSNANDPNAIVSGMAPNTTYTFTWTIVNSCGATSDNVDIATNGTQGAGIANAGADRCLAASTTSITMAAAAVTPATATGTWSMLSGPNTPTITNSASPGTTITGLTAGTYTFAWTLKVTGCDPVADTVVTTISPTLTTSNAGSTQTLCAANVTLAGNSPSVGTGTWSQVAGPGGATVADPLLPNTAVNGLMSGYYKFRWTIASGVCSNFSDVIVNVSTPPSAAVVAADSTCLVRTTLNSMTGNTPAYGIGTWSQVSGPNLATIATASSPTSGLSGLINGNYVFRWIINGGAGCTPSTADMAVSVNIPVANISNINVCNSSSATLSGTANVSGTWTQVTGPSSSAIQAMPPNMAAVSSLQSGSYTFQFSPAAVGGCASQGTKTMTVNNSAPATAANAGNDLGLCNVTSFGLSGNAPSTGTGAWSRVNGPNTPTITGGSTPTPSMSGATAGTYTYRWTITNGGCTSLDDVIVTISAAATTANAGTNQTVCSNTGTANLSGNTPTVGTGVWSQVSGPSTAVFSNTASPTPSLTSLATAGNYVFRYTISNGACSNNSQTTVKVDEMPTAYAGPDDNTCITSYNLKATQPSAGAGAWTQVSGPASTISNTAAYNATVSGLVGGNNYVYRWTVANGSVCPAAISNVTITVCNTTLPVTLVSFTGREEQGISSLRWEVTGERELDRFEVERSSTGNDFRTIGVVKASEQASFVYSYREPFAAGLAVQHYRLKMVDRNGKWSYSNVVQVRRTTTVTQVLATPNPARGFFQLQIDHSRNEAADLRILTTSGELVYRQHVSLQQGRQVLSLPGTSNLAAGTYEVILSLADGQRVKVRASMMK